MPGQQPSNDHEPENLAESAELEVKRENPLLNIGFNIAVPFLILKKGKDWFGGFLEPYFENVAIPVLLVAVAFPAGYFIYDYVKRKKYNIFSILGLVSVLLTGGIGIFELSPGWFAIKEAAIPAILGLAVVISLKTPYPLIRTLLYNPEIMNVDRVRAALARNDSQAAFEKLLQKCTYLLAASFLLSAVLNYALARWIVTSPSGTDAFNDEVGDMMVWSWPVIVVPSMIIMMVTLWLLVSGILKMTGLKLEEVLRGAEESNTKS